MFTVLSTTNKYKLCDKSCGESKEQHYHIDGRVVELLDYPKNKIVNGEVEVPFWHGGIPQET